MNAGTGWAGRSVLVTGAGGFVGSCLAERLAADGAEVTVVLRDQPHHSNFSHLGLERRVNVVRGSIEDRSVVERALNEYEVDTCFHLAAQALVGAANRSPVSTFEANIRGTWAVLEACRLTESVRAVVVASSDKAYGTQPVLPYTEEMPLLGRNPYDASKACGDILAQSYHHTYGLPVVIARCANIYGGGDLNWSRLVPGTMRSAFRGEAPVVRSDGTPVRDYMHVDDAVEAYLALACNAMRDDVAGRAFNFGTDSPISALDMVGAILDAAGASHLEPRVLGVARFEIDRQYLSSERAMARLGWRAQVSLSDGLQRAARWYGDYLAAPDPHTASRREIS